VLVLLLVLVLENSAYLAVKVMEQNNWRRIGPSFRRESHRSSTTTRTSTIPPTSESGSI